MYHQRLFVSLLSIFSFLSLCRSKNYTNKFLDCATTSIYCGSDRFIISYPFRLASMPAYCGHPKFEVQCINHNSSMIISIMKKKYSVHTIRYDIQFVGVSNLDYAIDSCPHRYSNTSLDYSLYDYFNNVINMTFFYNCSPLYHPNIRTVPCLSNISTSSGYHSTYYSLPNDNPPFSELTEKCNSTVLIPMYGDNVNFLVKERLVFLGVLHDGFGLKWVVGNGFCDSCKNSGGVCGNDLNETVGPICFCSDGTITNGTCPDDKDYSLCSTIINPCHTESIEIYYPFRLNTSPEYCGLPDYVLSCSDDNKSLVTSIYGKKFVVKTINYQSSLLHVAELDFFDQNFSDQSCASKFTNTSFDFSVLNYTGNDLILKVYIDCSADLFSLGYGLGNISCPGSSSNHNTFYEYLSKDIPDIWNYCTTVVLIPITRAALPDLLSTTVDVVGALKRGFELIWNLEDKWCETCMQSTGICYTNKTIKSGCYCSEGYTSENGACTSVKTKKKKRSGAVLGVVSGVGGLFLLGTCVVLSLWVRKKRKLKANSSNLLSQTASSVLSSKMDPETEETNYNTHVFTYDELEEATHGFHESREVGDGGFGTVYKGKLRDGRTVAVKRLYENNYRRLDQFLNEVEILSRLRHQNLVTLYGCTSRHSRELLLVYEYIPNGTLADHLHGPLSCKPALPWPTRLSLIIQTAEALSYLHSVEPQIIHRDIKTTNILVDHDFRVKVADFGLSRLFPLNATHVSTAPQGTPGYVDPEYHLCFQLTDKSDVYSFGVVLVEIISSKPAVDISRHRHEISLANMAISMIQNCRIDELVDPGLGYGTDAEVRRMVDQVAELAFRCLQADGEMRPGIKEVLGVLRRIKGEVEGEGVDSPGKEESKLLKNVAPFSPDSVVTGRWSSRSTTPNTSA